MSARASVVSALVSCVLLAGVAHADKPGPLGFRLVWVYEKSLAKLDPESPLCKDDVAARRPEAERLLATIKQGLARAETERVNVPERDLAHPDVVKAIARMDALGTCAKHIEDSLAGGGAAPVPNTDTAPKTTAAPNTDTASTVAPTETDDPPPPPVTTPEAATAPLTIDGFVASLTPTARADLALLAAFKTASASGVVAAPGAVAAAIPEGLDELERVRAAADGAWTLCTGKFAGLVMGGRPAGELPADADPWGWCTASADRATRIRDMAKGLVDRGLQLVQQASDELKTTVATAKQAVAGTVAKVGAAAEDAKAVLEAGVLSLKAEVEEIDALMVIAGVAAVATPEATKILDGAKAVYASYATEVASALKAAGGKALTAAKKAVAKLGTTVSPALNLLGDKARRLVHKAARPVRSVVH